MLRQGGGHAGFIARTAGQVRVVKIGGSLEQAGGLRTCLNRVVDPKQDGLVIVPGGGIFADQVRLAQQRWGFDDVSAHQMAILAMQQMALLFKALKQQLHLANSVAEIRQELESGHSVVWSPGIDGLNAAGIEASWDITSDSLAAWLATELGAKELVLIKAAAVAASGSIQELADQGIVDRAFVRFTENSFYHITIINQDSL